MERLPAQIQTVPQGIPVDNGSEFISKALDKWAYAHKVTLGFSRPGKPRDNAYMESFNGSLGEECLSMHWLLSLEDAQGKIQKCSQEDNTFRPHSSRQDLTPQEVFNKSISPVSSL